MKTITCAAAKKIDMVQYLSDLGFEPAKIQGNDYWYLSPLRSEHSASFKVNRKFNVWYDHGIQKGGNLVDFGILFHQCNVEELLIRISQQNSLSFHPPFPAVLPPSPVADEKQKIIVLEARPAIQLMSLQNYVLSRKIPLAIANRFCSEVDFGLNGKKITAIGFKNSSGGYELRNAFFKGSCSPKDVTLMGKSTARDILVFEGFMDFLSYQTMQSKKMPLLSKQQADFLILNSIGFLEKMKERLTVYNSVHLYLDRDASGLNATKHLLGISEKYKDESQSYKMYKDLNEYLVQEYPHKQQQQKHRLGL
ncbi:MAG: toprim domain-containing protein [Bacteroidota bacterium]